MLNQLRALFKKNYHIDNIDESTNLKNDLGLTSFDFINLIAIIEDTFHIEVDEEKYHSINTIGDLIDYIENTGR
ncbi:MAG: acyl carrier protein [Lachnospiraceae bacterium]|nr:acyl carrier protein [Lachnospiraceae bacterium]